MEFRKIHFKIGLIWIIIKVVLFIIKCLQESLRDFKSKY